MYRFRSSLIALVSMLVVSAVCCVSEDAAGQERCRETWITPNGQSPIPQVQADMARLWDDQREWASVLARADAFTFYISDDIPQDPETMQRAVKLLRRHGVTINVEGGGTLALRKLCGDPIGLGSRSARIELNEIQPIYDAGGKVTWFSMDGPLSRIIANGREGNCGFTLQQAVEAVVAYMQVFHSVHPAVRLGLITNFPNWHYGSIPSYWATDYGDFQVAFETLLAAVDAAGEKLWFVHADNPYDFATGQQPSDTLSDPTQVDWIQRILDLEAQVRLHGLRFGLIYNSSMGADVSDQRYLEDTLAYIKLYRQRGGDPDEAIIESWYDRPSAVLPESQAFTFMYTARAALEFLQRRYAEGDDVGERASTRGARAECRTRGRSRQPGA